MKYFNIQERTKGQDGGSMKNYKKRGVGGHRVDLFFNPSLTYETWGQLQKQRQEGVGSDRKGAEMWTPQSKKPTLVTSLPEVEDLKFYIVHKQNKSVQNNFSVLFLKASLRGTFAI